MTYQDISKALNISYQGAVKKVKSNKEALKDYLILNENGAIRGITDEGLEVLRNLPHRTSYAVKRESENAKKIDIQEQQIEMLQEVIDTQKAFIEELKKDKETLQTQVIELTAELKSYRKGGFFAKLLGNR